MEEHGGAEAGERLGFGAAAAVEVGCRGCGCGLKRRGPEIWACGMGRGITARITAVIREAVERGRVREGGLGKRARMVSGCWRGRATAADQLGPLGREGKGCAGRSGRAEGGRCRWSR